MPIFDSVLDTFDCLRTRELSCFTIILALACCVEDISKYSGTSKATIQEEVKRPTGLGNVQAMLLLAAYAGEAWFSNRHALQMAGEFQLYSACES